MHASGYRKLGKTTPQRKALLRNQVTNLLYHGKIKTTETRAKEVKRIAEKLITLAIKEKDNFEVKEKTVSRAKLDKNGKKVKETKTSKNGKKYEVIVREVVRENKNVDKPSKLAARKKMFRNLNKISDFNGNTVDLTEKLFNEIAPKYEKATGGYTRIIKLVPRKGDGAEMAIIELI